MRGEVSPVVRVLRAPGLGCMCLILPGTCWLGHVMHCSELQFLYLQMRELGERVSHENVVTLSFEGQRVSKNSINKLSVTAQGFGSYYLLLIYLGGAEIHGEDSQWPGPFGWS